MAFCSHCGEWVSDDAVSCRSCGSDAETGWSQEVDYKSLDIPDYLIATDDEPWSEPPPPREKWSDPQLIAGLLLGTLVLGFLTRVLITEDLVVCGVIALGTLALVSEVLYRRGVLETRFVSRSSSLR